MSKEQTAYHEAGHAVMFVALGRPFRYVTIRPRTPGLLGQVVPRLGRARWIDQAYCLAAGPIATTRYQGRELDDDELENEFDFARLGIALLSEHTSGPLTERTAKQAFERLPSDHAELVVTDDFFKFTNCVDRIGLDTMFVWRDAEMLAARHVPATEAVAQALLCNPRALTYREVQELALPLLVSPPEGHDLVARPDGRWRRADI